MPGTVARISLTPVKGLRLQHPDAIELGLDGAPGDRTFFVVDARGDMISATRLGPLVSVVAEHDAAAGTLALRFADGSVVEGEVEPGPVETVRFYGEPLEARPVGGAFSAALSELVGQPLRLLARGERPGVDRGRDGAATIVSRASLERLAAEASADEPVDDRRFRMLLLVDGLAANEEDEWVGRRVRVGEALVSVRGNVGRCALTTRDPESGVVDFPTLHVLRRYRGELATTEPLALGVYGAVLEPGRVAVGDAVAPVG